jgi:hypothetical protein
MQSLAAYVLVLQIVVSSWIRSYLIHREQRATRSASRSVFNPSLVAIPPALLCSLGLDCSSRLELIF